MSFDQIFASLNGEPGSPILPGVIHVILFMSPFILAWILAYMFWHVWLRYIRAKFILSQKHVLLEIKLPKETLKSPLAMELFLTSLHQTGGEGTWVAKFWNGQVRPWFSLEMISIEGQVKFLIWSRAGNKGFIESSLYAQFPGIEIHERPDYAIGIHFDPAKLEVWGGEIIKAREDAYPLKTYVDYGLDKDPKEEFKVDPLAPLIEYLGSVGPNQQVWIQILIRAHKKEQRAPGHLWKQTDAWKDEANAIVNKILVRNPKTKESGNVDKEAGTVSRVTITPGEQDVVKAIERGISKQSFDAGIRCIYIADKGFFNPSNIPSILGSWKQFSTENLNGFKPNSAKWHPHFDYPWQDFRNILKDKASKYVISAYKRRSFFYPPYESKPFVLNTEELATIFHFPGQVAQTPTLERIPSKKAQAPANLPI